MTTRTRLRFWLAVLAVAPRHSEAEAQAIRMVDELVEKIRRERKHGRQE